MKADVVGYDALQFGDDGSAEDGADEDAGALAGEGAEILNAEGEDRREHDGVEEADEEQSEHGDMAMREDAENDEDEGDDADETSKEVTYTKRIMPIFPPAEKVVIADPPIITPSTHDTKETPAAPLVTPVAPTKRKAPWNATVASILGEDSVWQQHAEDTARSGQRVEFVVSPPRAVPTDEEVKNADGKPIEVPV